MPKCDECKKEYKRLLKCDECCLVITKPIEMWTVVNDGIAWFFCSQKCLIKHFE